MKIYAQLDTNNYVIDFTETLKCPDDHIEMSEARPEGDWHAKADGKWHNGDHEKEQQFIESEMQFIAEQLLMHDDGDEEAIATAQQWRDYRKALRRWNWSDNENFPDPSFRPKRPN